MRVRNRVWIAGWIVVTAIACQNTTQPQRPTFQGQAREVDSVALSLITLHQTMAEKADLQLARIADEGYVLMDENYWVKGLGGEVENGEELQEGEWVDVTVECSSLEGKLLTTHQSTVRMGQVDEIQAVVQVLGKMKHKMQVEMLVPWYLAYGSAGNGEVPPYENIHVKLSVK